MQDNKMENSSTHLPIRKDRTKMIDFILALGALLISLVSFYLLWDERWLFENFYQKTLVGEVKIIAQLDQIHNDVRHRSKGKIQWMPASTHDALAEGELVFTGNSSYSKIVFKNGKSIELGPEGLISIQEEKNGEVELTFFKGSMKGELSEGLAIKIQDESGKTKTIRSKGAKIKLHGGNLKVLSGSAIINKTALKSGQQLDVASTGQRAPTQFEANQLIDPPVPLFPKDKDRFRLRYNKDLAFEVFSNDPVDLYEIQIRRDGQSWDQSIVKSSKTTMLKVQGLPPAQYYWRARSKAHEYGWGEFSKEHSFMALPPIEKLKAPVVKERYFELQVRLEKTFYDYLSKFINFFISDSKAAEEDERVLELNWDHDPHADHHQIDIATDSNFTKIVHSAQVNSDHFQWKDYFPGHFYWRVRSFSNETGHGPYSDPGEFLIKLKPPTKIKAKETPKGDKVNLSWQASKFAQSYRIEWGKNSKTLKNKARWKGPPKKQLDKLEKSENLAFKVCYESAHPDGLMESCSQTKNYQFKQRQPAQKIEAPPVIQKPPPQSEVANNRTTLPPPKEKAKWPRHRYIEAQAFYASDTISQVTPADYSNIPAASYSGSSALNLSLRSRFRPNRGSFGILADGDIRRWLIEGGNLIGLDLWGGLYFSKVMSSSGQLNVAAGGGNRTLPYFENNAGELSIKGRRSWFIFESLTYTHAFSRGFLLETELMLQQAVGNFSQLTYKPQVKGLMPLASGKFWWGPYAFYESHTYKLNLEEVGGTTREGEGTNKQFSLGILFSIPL